MGCPYVANKGRSGLHLDKFHGGEYEVPNLGGGHIYTVYLYLWTYFVTNFLRGGGPKIVARGPGGKMTSSAPLNETLQI